MIHGGTNRNPPERDAGHEGGVSPCGQAPVEGRSRGTPQKIRPDYSILPPHQNFGVHGDAGPSNRLVLWNLDHERESKDVSL